MTPAEQRNHREAFARVLSKWAEKGEVDHIARGRLETRLGRIRIISSRRVVTILSSPDLIPADMWNTQEWILGPAVNIGTPTFVPVATAAVKFDDIGGVLMAGIRVGLLVSGSLDALGWRFESPDRGTDPAHPYPHAQPICEWVKEFPIREVGASANGVDAAAAVGRIINERRPAFPLRSANTIAGLAAVTLAALHGAPAVRGWLLEISRPGVPQAVWADVNASVATAVFPATTELS